MNYLHHPKVQLAARTILQGRAVAYPTEAVWGLGCDPFCSHAVSDILKLKRRAPSKGLILVAADVQQFDFLLRSIPSTSKTVMLQSWPGPNTWLVPHNDAVPSWISGNHATVAIRVSAHPVVRALSQLVGGPIVSTSANPQGLAAARFGYDVRRYFGTSLVCAAGQVDFNASPSRIRDLISGETLRL